jgi:3',5'-cyclic AMP phosphodiesterase CpdA
MQRVLFFADFGLNNDVSMASLNQEGMDYAADYAIHGGDIAYDLFASNPAKDNGNRFMNAIEPLTSRIPYMAIAGNHEAHDNFTAFHQRFNTTDYIGKNSRSNSHFYYSWDHGLVHYIGICTETYKFPMQTAWSPQPFTNEEQFAWLEQDLKKANANREQVPWIVMFGHKAWYMDFEPNKNDPLQQKLVTNFTGFTDLSHRYGVDLYLAGHVHIYQRFFPLLGPKEHKIHAKPLALDTASVSKDQHTYTDPKYMTTIIAGSPGDQEETVLGECGVEDVITPQAKGTVAVCEGNYGYGGIHVYNRTHLYWEYYETGGPSPPVPPTPVPPALSPPSLLSAVPAAQEEEHTQGLEVHANTNTMRGDGENTVGVDRAQTAAPTGSGKKTTKDHLWLIVNQHGPRPPLFLGA